MQGADLILSGLEGGAGGGEVFGAQVGISTCGFEVIVNADEFALEVAAGWVISASSTSGLAML